MPLSSGPRLKSSLAIEARHLTKIYDNTPVVHDLDLSIKSGECFGFLGPNGAGKTSTMRMVYASSPLSSGTLKVLGVDVQKNPKEVKSRIGVVPQEDILDPDLTVWKNLEVFGRYYGMGKERIAARSAELLGWIKMLERKDSRIDTLSGGMKRRLTLVPA